MVSPSLPTGHHAFNKKEILPHLKFWFAFFLIMSEADHVFPLFGSPCFLSCRCCCCCFSNGVLSGAPAEMKSVAGIWTFITRTGLLALWAFRCLGKRHQEPRDAEASCNPPCIRDNSFICSFIHLEMILAVISCSDFSSIIFFKQLSSICCL